MNERDRGMTGEARLAALQDWFNNLSADAEGRRLRDEDLQRIAYSDAQDVESVKQVPMVSNTRLLRSLAADLAQVLSGESESEADEIPLAFSGVQEGGQGSQAENWDFAPADLALLGGSKPLVSIGTTVLFEGIELVWPADQSNESVVVYRLVSGESHEPPSPDHGSLVATTLVNQAQDPTAFTSAVRYYRVWVNRGPDKESAMLAQPILHADAQVIAPVQDCIIAEDEGVVVGKWRVVPGTSRVAVHRSDPGASFSPANVLPGADNLHGFQDHSAEPGRSYQYSVFAIADVGGTSKQSAGVSQEVSVSARLDPVDDLEVLTYQIEGVPQFDLEWTPPSNGEVRIYRTESEPSPGLKTETRELDAIEREGLDESARVNYPSQRKGSKDVITRVSWPREWSKAYFTPVTVLGSKGRVGPTRAEVRTGDITDAVLVERVARQVVVFGWPPGAVRVAAYVTPPGVALGDSTKLQAQKEIGKQDYERLGGLELHLPGDRVDVHLVPKSWVKGQIVLGQEQVLEYPGLLRLRYRLRPVVSAPTGKGWLRKKKAPQQTSRYIIELMSDRDLSLSPEMVLVHNSSRLPISELDGIRVLRAPQRRLTKNQPADLCESDLSHTVGGYVRLFVAQPNLSVGVAVLDPDIVELQRL